MIKKLLTRFMNGFCCSITITLVIHYVLNAAGVPVMMPEYIERFTNELSAYMTELLLIGLMSAVTSAGTVIFDCKRPGLILQSLVFLLIMLAAWIPVACFVWGFHRYTGSMISTLLSILVTYGICWSISYRVCRREVEQINAKLKERKK